MTVKTILIGTVLVLTTVFARAESVPSLMSYQGRVTDANGDLIGISAPVNRTVTFRFYSASSGGSAIYAETQTVTISAGEFSVLIGNGTGVSGSPGPSSPASTPYQTIGDIVNGSSYSALYLGITVDDGNNATVDAEIAPRQQLVSGAFALRAQVAESVASAAISSSMISDSAVNTNQISASAVTSAKIADGSILAADIANSNVTAEKIDTDSIGIWSPSGRHIYRGDGNVGIGEGNPGFPLNFASALGDKISLYGSGGNHYGFGIQSSLLQIHSSTSGSDIAFGYGSSEAFTETFRIKGNGNVGIGTSTPGSKLDIGGTILLNGAAGRNYFKDIERNDGNGLRVGTAWGMYGTYAETGVGVLGGRSGASLQNNSLYVATNGKVGIGTTSPASRLSVRESSGSVASRNNGTILLEHDNAGGASSIVFKSKVNSTSDFGYIQYQDTNTINGSGEASKLIIGTQNDQDDDILIMPSGKVGIKTTNTSQGELTVGGTIVTTGVKNGREAYARFRYGDIRGGGAIIDLYNSNHNSGWRHAVYNGDSNWDFNSDARLKKDIKDAEPVLDRVLQIRLRRFRWRDEVEPVEPEFGVIAQEILPLFPDIVSQTRLSDQDEDTYTVGYTTFGTIAIKAIQELKQRNDEDLYALENELSEKDAKIADLERRLAAIEQMLSAAK